MFVERLLSPSHMPQIPVLMEPLQTEIHQISRQTIPDVETWISNARAVHEDIERLRRLATDIVREAEADEERLDLLSDRNTHLELLQRENLFNKSLSEALERIQQINDTVDNAERVADEKNILEALRLLAGAVQRADPNV